LVRIAGIGEAYPGQYHRQEKLLAVLRDLWGDDGADPAKLAALFRNCSVDGRHVALPLEEYLRPRTFGESNKAWMAIGEEIGAVAVERALDAAGLGVEDVDALVFVSVTGLGTPSLDARLANRLRFRSTLTRIPIFGLGCVGGAASLARGADLARVDGRGVVLVLSVELCSLTFRPDDRSGANLVAAGLFGDGAAAVVLVGNGRIATGPQVVASRSVFYPDTEEVMGWEISESGFRLVLSPRIPQMVRENLRNDVDRFLGDHGLTRADVSFWMCHTGGPKVLSAIQETLDLPPGALDVSWERLRSVGNVSSASVLQVLKRTIDTRRPPAGTHGMLLAFGPGFCSELVLLQWPGAGAPQ
jgi:alkylresorcinol/alkylpyrone synthase